MSLDLTKLENVRTHGGKTIARCPACAEQGMDESGEHLIIQPDGRFGCVVHPGPDGKPHRQRIAKLAGARGVPAIRVRVAPLAANDGRPVPILAPVRRPESRSAGKDARSLRNEAGTALHVVPPVYSLECGEPGFREPENREWIVGLYRQDDGALFPLLLWADPKVDYFYDVARRRHVLPPRLYLRLAEQPQMDPVSGHPIIDGAECPF
jgi:hypothetical protein